MNVYVKENMNGSEKVTTGDQETVANVFADIPFLDSHSLYFSEKMA